MVGMTGSGKTFLAEYILRYFKYVVVFDAKGLINWNGYELHRELEQLYRTKADRIIYRPNIYELTDPDKINDFFKFIYQRQNTVCYIDEVFAVAPSWQETPFFYKAILTRGRELGITTISATQRPAGIPSEILSESEYGFWFKCKLPSDAEKVEKCTGIDREYIQDLRKEYFYYTSLDETLGPLHYEE